jgi:CHASE2 domain-containing sensor protein
MPLLINDMLNLGVPFIVAPELFDKYDTSKLLLLSFAMSAPVFGVTWGGTVLNDFLNKGRDSKELLKNTAEYITMASFVTVLIYGLFIMDVFWRAKGEVDPRLVLILPVGLGTVGMLVVVSAHALRSSKKKPQKVET